MAQYNIKMTEISAEMLDELADFAHRAWGRTDTLEVEVVPGQTAGEWNATRIETWQGEAVVTVPDPIPAAPTGSIEIVLPPEPVEDFEEHQVDEVTPITKAKRR